MSQLLKNASKRNVVNSGTLGEMVLAELNKNGYKHGDYTYTWDRLPSDMKRSYFEINRAHKTYRGYEHLDPEIIVLDPATQMGEILKFAGVMNEVIKIKTGMENHVVEFKDNGIQVGCTFVPSKTVEAIYKKLFEERK